MNYDKVKGSLAYWNRDMPLMVSQCVLGYEITYRL